MRPSKDEIVSMEPFVRPPELDEIRELLMRGLVSSGMVVTRVISREELYKEFPDVEAP